MTDGRIKLIFSGEELTLVGASIIGKAATEVIHELTLAVTHKLTHMDLKHTIHAHPTTSEIIWFTVFKGMLADSTESYMQMMKEKMGK
jgi:dihydrolipoamide dehydrogenase